VVTAQLSPAAAAEALAPVLRGPVVAGRVIAVLGLAVYLECPRGLVAVLAPGAVPVPVGLRPADGVLPPVVVGDATRVGEGQVWLRPGAAGGEQWHGWGVCRWWPSAVRPRAGRPEPAVVAALQVRLPPLPPELSAAIRSGPPALVGLGEGLTPLGDDVLAGLLVAWSAWPETAAGRRPALASTVTALLGRTTPISATLLRQAVDGHAALPLLAVVDALAVGEGTAIDSAATGLLAVGHTSGIGLARGLLWGLTGATSELGGVA
jgi:hypothetical protein